MQKILEIFKDFSPKVYKDDNIKMMCPFRDNHEGKRATASGLGLESFFVSLEKNVYHCWSCGAKGKATLLLAKVFNVPFYDAIEMVNLMPVIKPPKEEYELSFMWDIIPPTEFLDRGVKKEILKKHLVGYDKRGNICIPLYFNHKLRGVKLRNGRDFWFDSQFEREGYLYNYNPDYEEVIVVEGEVDNYFVEQWGYNVCAIMGSHLTNTQADLLAKIPKIYFALDNDDAGIKGMHGAYAKLKNRTDVYFLNYPAEDPAACKRRQFDYAYRNPCSYAEFNLYT